MDVMLGKEDRMLFTDTRTEMELVCRKFVRVAVVRSLTRGRGGSNLLYAID